MTARPFPSLCLYGHLQQGALPLKGLTPYAPYFVILLCLMPDNFTHQGESAATQWVNLLLDPVYLKE
jgi:hypothetical protein